MDALSFKTRSVSRREQQKNWLVVDAQDQVLGRLASQIATLLRGKHKPSFTPHVFCGDAVIVINSDKVRLTGKKWTDRTHLSHTGYPSGQRAATPQQIHNRFPTRLVEQAVRRMLPKNKLGDEMFRHLHVYVGAEHPHEGQQPETFQLPYDTSTSNN